MDMKKIQGEWIGYYVPNPQIDEEKYRTYAPYFRKTFSAGKDLRKAELKIAALGWFKAYINGKEITKDEEFLTSWTDYNQRIEYISYDVTDKLREENAIGVVLGNGWACGAIIWENAKTYYNVKNPCFIAEIVLTYADGKTQNIVTDSSWKANIGEIVYNDILYGEYIDHRKSLDNFSGIDYNADNWYAVQIRESRSELLTEETAPRTRVKERLPVRYMHTVDGKDIYTTDQNMTGLIECDVKGQAGTKIVFRYGEMLTREGSLYTENLRTAEATDTYICSGTGIEHFRPLFTFHGFQYIEISVEGTATVSGLSALVIYSDLQRTGEFYCSNDLVNKIYSNALWGQKCNFVNVPTDCPQRDERLGWTGDAQVFCGTAMYNMDCRSFFRKYLQDVRDTQSEEGSVGCIAPGVKGLFVDEESTSAWSDVIIILPYYYYLYYGDINILRENISAMKRYMQYVENISEDYIRKSRCFNDWLSYEDTDPEVFHTAFFIYDYMLLERICKILHDGDAELYEKKYERAKARFLEKFVDENGKILSDTQSAYLFAYQFGILSGELIKPHLLRAIERNNGKLSTGFIGIKFLLPTLCDIGATDLAYRLINEDGFPSWGYSVRNGATTMWERWDSYTVEKGFQDASMNSFNHYSFGSCVEWYYAYILGIKPVTPGFKEICIKPFIDLSGILTSAEGSYQTEYGKISIKWQTEGKEAVLTVSVPEKIAYTVEIPRMFVKKQEKEASCHKFYLQSI